MTEPGPHLILVDEGRGNAGLATPPSTTDTVDVVLDLVWHVKIDDMLDFWEVQSLGRHIGSHQYVLWIATTI